MEELKTITERRNKCWYFITMKGGERRMERFIKEYANYRKNDITKNELMKKEYKINSIDTINKVLKLKDKGLITTNEAIKIILEA